MWRTKPGLESKETVKKGTNRGTHTDQKGRTDKRVEGKKRELHTMTNLDDGKKG